MNIVYVSREFGPITGGGIGTYIFHVTTAMAARGHRVWLLTNCGTEATRHHFPPGVTVLPPEPVEPARTSCYSTVSQEYADRVLRTLRALVKREVIDLIEFPEYGAEGFSAIRAKRLLNEFADQRLVVKLHTPRSLLREINEDKQLHLSDELDMYMEDYAVRHADLVTSPSRDLARYFSERLGIPMPVACPYPLDLPRLTHPRRFDAPMRRRVRFTGSVQVRKGVDVFIDAAVAVLRQDPTFEFEIVGAVRNATCFGKSYQDVLQTRIPPEFRDRIRFRGALPYAEMPALLLDSCFCVFPSRWENWPNVCLEAMAMGCIPIGSRRGGMAEMITEGADGFLTDPDQPDQIARILLAHVDDVDGLHRLSAAAHRKAHALCDPDRIVARILANYETPRPPRAWQTPGDPPPLVSIVIPFYNQGSYLPETIASARASTYPRIEIVVVNDGCTDPASQAVFDALTGVTKVSQANAGLSEARNAGVRASRGEFVIMLDSDDLLHVDYARLGVAALLNNPGLGYVSCYARNFGAVNSVCIPVGYVPTLMPFFNTDGKCTNVYRRTVFDHHHYDPLMVSYEDWDFLVSLNQGGIAGDVIPEEMFDYRRHLDSMVFTTANAYRTELIQYMMCKHRPGWSGNAADAAIVLAGLWKQLEQEFDLTGQDRLMRLRLYVAHGPREGFTDARSVTRTYVDGQWATVHVELEPHAEYLQLRLDPTETSGRITIAEILVRDHASRKVLWRATGPRGFRHCHVGGTGKRLPARGGLRLESSGNDPHILLPRLPASDRKRELQVTLHSSATDPDC